ncbi:MAG: cytochrome c, class I [Candidatus Thiodiazotropha sp. (ex Lucinoma borealis)]|nr:cytochrome c, class I [Candidatus Thiodiazotropha sp. (ex Lucinoma borealis)]MCU7855467.1 cytochrome c, class I [Candidatus Thiodiazotropha sp. (ex Lucinoma borealis)]MCU7866585.1 cytochrome c, class I [Candidatus Thiodiazotropha sp. (ex Lucinoma borealis)]MCU7868584.1 cytochrome c, class I [Candidatus Thiodiazotropha sp. (ex Lucinoma borealis)]
MSNVVPKESIQKKSKSDEEIKKILQTPVQGKIPVDSKVKSNKASVGDGNLHKKRTAKNSVNNFNRLLRPPSKRNLPPAKDGIHDPTNEGTHILQPPKDSFSQLPSANTGNRVDWVSALDKGAINPRYDRIDPDKNPIILDLNIVREVKGSMPDVVYPHKQHTEWLDCSNCHPAIFIPMKGANNISMASILLGEKCGVCHGKVAFPVSECRKCHSQNKTK